MRSSVLDDFPAIRAAQRETADADGLCVCPKYEQPPHARTGEVNDRCPVHGKNLDQMARS